MHSIKTTATPQNVSSQELRESELTQLPSYGADTAGRIMKPELISLKENLTVAETLEQIRRLVNACDIYYLYVTDETRRLTGILSLRELVTAQPEQMIGVIMTQDVVFVKTDTEQEEVARCIHITSWLYLW